MSVDSLRAPADTLPAASLRRRPQLAGRLAGARIAGWWVAAAIVAFTVAAFLLRSGALNFHYWIDEGISVGIASHPLRELPSLLRQDGSPPLYYVLLHFWMRAFGRGEVTTHSLSLLFAVLAVPVSYWAANSLFGRRAGIFCAVLAAGLPFLNTYAQETRMYSLLLLLSVIAAAAHVHVFAFRRPRYLPLFVVSLVAVLYTHNWGLFLGLAAFGAYLICLWRAGAERRALLRNGVLGFGLVAVLYAPWLPTLLYQAGHTGAPWALPPVLWSLPQGLYFLVGGRGAAMALLFGGATGLLALRARRPEDRSLLTATVSLAALGLGTLLIAWLYAKVTPAWAFRYLAVVAGPMLLLTGLGLARSARLGLAALILVSCFWVLDPTPRSLDSKSNVGAAAKAIRPGTSPGTLVLSTQPEQVPTLAYYLPDVSRFGTPLGAVPDPRVVDWRGALERFRKSTVTSVLAPLLQSLRPGQRVALVVPTRFVKGQDWMSLIAHASRAWTAYLEQDRRLRLLERVDPHAGNSGLPVEISLFEVMRGPRG